MRRGTVKYLVCSAILVLMSGCGLFVYEQRAPWRDEAERTCLSSGVVKVTPWVEPAREISGPGACGMLQPFRVSAFADGTVGLTSRATLACPLIPVVDGWLEDVVQPAAQLYFGTRVSELRAGSYSCRNVNNRAGGPRSEHSFGNALDVMAFRFADGRELTVERGWRGAPRDQEFLREVFVGLCSRFTTVLGPGSDAEHYNHFHFDLARHSRGRSVCKPILKFEPRLPAYLAANGQMSARPAPVAAMPQQGYGSGPGPRPQGLAAGGQPLMLGVPGNGDEIGDLIDEQGVVDPPEAAPLPPPASMRPPAPVRRY